MGGVDKGLQPHRGQPLAWHALQRLSPQVGSVLINANRNQAVYGAWGVPVCADTLTGYPGPLAGWLAGLAQCRTPWLATVPCDTPGFPTDLVQRLSDALVQADAEIAMATTLERGGVQPQPVFCLLRCTLAASLAAYLQAGDRQIERWTATHRCVPVPFEDAAAFFNANSADDLAALQSDGAAANGQRP